MMSATNERKIKLSLQPAFKREIQAAHFYRQCGYEINRLLGHLRGIDLSKPIKVMSISLGTKLKQFTKDASQGNYYCEAKAKPTEIGIAPYYTNHDEKKQLRHEAIFTVTKTVAVLVSTAAAILDTFSCKGKAFQTAGGGLQFFSNKRDAFAIEDAEDVSNLM